MNLAQRKASFIAKAKKIYGDKYEYARSEYFRAKSKVTVTCKKHGDFNIVAHNLIRKQASCPKCVSRNKYVSGPERELAEFISGLGFEVITSDRSILKGFEIDLVIPEAKLAIEFNGMYFHSQQRGKRQGYHLSKTTKAAEEGYDLIHIWEDQWNTRKDQVKEYLVRHLSFDGLKKTRIKTVTELSQAQALLFLDQNSILVEPPEFDRALGLFKNKIIVASITLADNKITSYTFQATAPSNSLEILLKGLGPVEVNLDRCLLDQKHFISLGFELVRTNKPKLFAYSLKSGLREIGERMVKIWDCGSVTLRLVGH
jgi:very-short-patch-repair endonuclease